MSIVALALLLLLIQSSVPALAATIWVSPSSGLSWTSGTCDDEGFPCGITADTLIITEPTTVKFVAGSGAALDYPNAGLIRFDNNGDSSNVLILDSPNGEAKNVSLTIESGETGSPVFGSVTVNGAFTRSSFKFTRLNALTFQSVTFKDVVTVSKAVSTITLDEVTWSVSNAIQTPFANTSVPLMINCTDVSETKTDITIELKEMLATCFMAPSSSNPSSRSCPGLFQVLSLSPSEYEAATYPPPRISMTAGEASTGDTEIVDFSTFLFVDFANNDSDFVGWAQPIAYSFQRNFIFDHTSLVEPAVRMTSVGLVRRPIFAFPQVTSIADSSFTCTMCSIQALGDNSLVTPSLLGMASGANWTSSASQVIFSGSYASGVSLFISSPSVDLYIMNARFEDCHVSVSSLNTVFLQLSAFQAVSLTGLANPLSRAFFQMASPKSLVIQSCSFIDLNGVANPTPNLLLVNVSNSFSSSPPSTSAQYYADKPTMIVDRLAVGRSASVGSSAGNITLAGWTIVRQAVGCYLGENDISAYKRFSANDGTDLVESNQMPCLLGFSRDGSTAVPPAIPLDNLLTVEGEVVFDNVQLASSLSTFQYKLKNVSSVTGSFFIHTVDGLYPFTDVAAADPANPINSSSPAISILWADSSSSPPSSTTPINIPVYTYRNKTLHNPIPHFNSELSDDRLIGFISRRSATASSPQGMYYSPAAPRECQLPKPQPLSSFDCQNGVWVSNATAIPAGGSLVVAGPILVVGNLNVSNATFIGMNTSIEVRGCANLPTTVFITLTPADITLLRNNKEYLATLISSSCNASSTYQGELHITTDGLNVKPCERVAGTIKADGTALTGLFTFDSSKCGSSSSKVWWIVLVSVIGGVLLLVLILALVFTQVPAARRCIRPYTTREENRKSGASRITN